jgi:prepilin-type N-terminal cleavage/methylation domain-containing protein
MNEVVMNQALINKGKNNRLEVIRARPGYNLCPRGFTLVELIITVAIVGVVMGSIYTVFVRSNRVYISQEEVVAAQQEARAALEILGREIRMTGFIAAQNQPGGASPITVAAWGGSADAGIEVAAEDAGTKTTTLVFKSDLDNDGNTDAIRYIYFWSDHPTTADRNKLFRRVRTWNGADWTTIDSGEQLFLKNIDDLRLNYEMADGTTSYSPTAANLSNIRGVEIEVTARTENEVEPYEGGKGIRERTLLSRIQMRNMGL